MYGWHVVFSRNPSQYDLLIFHEYVSCERKCLSNPCGQSSWTAWRCRRSRDPLCSWSSWSMGEWRHSPVNEVGTTYTNMGSTGTTSGFPRSSFLALRPFVPSTVLPNSALLRVALLLRTFPIFSTFFQATGFTVVFIIRPARPSLYSARSLFHI